MYLLLYEDDGPDGICGQSMHITSRWRRLIEVKDTTEAHSLIRLSSEELSKALSFCGINGVKGRKNARIVDWFSDEYDAVHLDDFKEIIHRG